MISMGNLVQRLLLVSLFIPTTISHLVGWGEPLTSGDFDYAPAWYRYSSLIWQCCCTGLLIAPLQLPAPTARSAATLLLSLVALLIVSAATPVLPAEHVLVYSMSLNCGLFGLLMQVRPTIKFGDADIRFLLHLFLVGFALQFAGYIILGISPSHTHPTFPIPRFNGLTNDSLASALLLPALVPSALNHRHNVLMPSLLIVCSFLTGSLFATVFTPLAMLGYMAARKNYAAVVALLCVGAPALILNLTNIIEIFEHKSLSILTHLRLFFELLGLDLEQPTESCVEEFCESLIESGLQLSPPFMLLYYIGLIWLLVKAFKAARITDSLTDHSILMLGLSILIASAVHPVPLIPFACTIFIVAASWIVMRSPSVNQSELRSLRVTGSN